ncbi:MAG: hypothetical protein BWY64_01422 [bacterium ADurb.Bin363]|nr:MAG: hypothetical protein BWY64_01422 [bacterium ADurb.Bin363]
MLSITKSAIDRLKEMKEDSPGKDFRLIFKGFG